MAVVVVVLVVFVVETTLIILLYYFTKSFILKLNCFKMRAKLEIKPESHHLELGPRGVTEL